MAEKKKVDKAQKEEKPVAAVEQNVVIVGKKQWHDYAAVILGRLDRGMVNIKARGLEGAMKTTNACCFLAKHYPEIKATITLKQGSFEKDGRQITLPIVDGSVWRE